ncbi:mitotic spindle assembly checkpoint protein MAD2B [Platysternon megacephalum]|uniref:Mitotic spindle assembly checkpoint protein MAD2B n=1 Tax=Platysternon megacephalum TaxID=55544 RepID=A0A4D9F3R0_9SAUR|nr:mitotic spindle assembly checkpoint protein MAD2B [Platysternon megacephalum]
MSNPPGEAQRTGGGDSWGSAGVTLPWIENLASLGTLGHPHSPTFELEVPLSDPCPGRRCCLPQLSCPSSPGSYMLPWAPRSSPPSPLTGPTPGGSCHPPPLAAGFNLSSYASPSSPLSSLHALPSIVPEAAHALVPTSLSSPVSLEIHVEPSRPRAPQPLQGNGGPQPCDPLRGIAACLGAEKQRNAGQELGLERAAAGEPPEPKGHPGAEQGTCAVTRSRATEPAEQSRPFCKSPSMCSLSPPCIAAIGGRGASRADGSILQRLAGRDCSLPSSSHPQAPGFQPVQTNSPEEQGTQGKSGTFPNAESCRGWHRHGFSLLGSRVPHISWDEQIQPCSTCCLADWLVHEQRGRLRSLKAVKDTIKQQ